MTEIETVVQPDRVTDDIGRESVAFIRIHRQIISFWRVNLAIPSADTVTLDQAKVGRLPRMDALQAQQMAQETARMRQVQLQRIDSALHRMDAGDYGYCFICGDEISSAIGGIAGMEFLRVMSDLPVIKVMLPSTTSAADRAKPH